MTINIEPLIDLLRLLWMAPHRFVRSARRHPKLWLAAACSGLLCVAMGRDAAYMVYLPAALVPWRLLHPASFQRWVTRPLRQDWRRTWRYERKWADIMRENHLGKVIHHGLDAIPRIVRVRTHGYVSEWEWGWPPVRSVSCRDTVLVEPLIGDHPDDYRDVSDRLAGDVGARECKVFADRHNRLRLEFHYGVDPLADTIDALAIPESPEAVDLKAIPVGLTENGDPWTIDVRLHLLIAGETRSGKSGILQGLIRGLKPLIDAGLVVIYCFDPKGGMELKALEPLCAGYSDADPQGMSERLGDLVTLLDQRQKRYGAQKIRKHVPSREEPLVLIVIDELAELTDKRGKEAKLASKLFSQVSAFLRRGAGVGFVLVGALQDPRVDVLPMRRGFPQKVATRLDNRDEDEMILGKRAVRNGFLASEIDQDMRGVAYAKMDGRADPVRVRAAYVTDEDIAAMVAEYTTKAPNLIEVG